MDVYERARKMRQSWRNVVENLPRKTQDYLNSQAQSDTYTILDVGCAQGYTLQELVNKYPTTRAYGVDPTIESRTEGAIEFIRGDAQNLPLPSNMIDFGYSHQTLKYVPDVLTALSEGYRVLKPGGFFAWQVLPEQIAANISFEDICSHTEGSEIFEQDENGLLVKKSIDDIFEGFPFRMTGIKDGEYGRKTALYTKTI